MAGPKLTDKEESFAQAYIVKEANLIEAYRASKYSQSLSAASMSVQANKLFNNPKIFLRIQELQSEADKIAKETFSISVKQRLEWLKQITEAGIDTYLDVQGNKRRESLTAARSAIETMNTMLGVNDDSSESAQPLSITFSVSSPVKEVKVVNAKS